MNKLAGRSKEYMKLDEKRNVHYPGIIFPCLISSVKFRRLKAMFVPMIDRRTSRASSTDQVSDPCQINNLFCCRVAKTRRAQPNTRPPRRFCRLPGCRRCCDTEQKRHLQNNRLQHNPECGGDIQWLTSCGRRSILASSRI